MKKVDVTYYYKIGKSALGTEGDLYIDVTFHGCEPEKVMGNLVDSDTMLPSVARAMRIDAKYFTSVTEEEYRAHTDKE